MDMLPLILMALGCFGILVLVLFVFSGPSPARAGARRMTALKARHAGGEAEIAAQIARKIKSKANTKVDAAAMRLLPNTQQLSKRLAMTGRTWTVGQYGMASVGIALLVAVLLMLKGAPVPLALFVGLFFGAGIPHFTVSVMIKRRIGKFTAKFPDAIDLCVRGLRSGLPITETMGVVGQEVGGPVGEEFRAVSDKMKIGRSLDVALQETADRLGTPEFQFFVITLAIQRETGGNLAETLDNLSDVLRKRSQMKLKIKAMSSEAKASAYIVGSLPFVVFAMIMMISETYAQNFFTDQRLMVAGIGGMIWMAIGAGIMAKMVNFEI